MNLNSVFNNETLKSMFISAGASCLISVVLEKGNPGTMAGIGALAALIYACTSEILRRLDVHPLSAPVVKTGIPYELTSSLHILGSLYLTRRILQITGSSSFNMANTAILTIGLSLFSNSVRYYHATHLVIA